MATAPVELFRNDHAVYYRDADHLAVELRWSPGAISEEAFRAEITRLAELLEQERVPNALIDVTRFSHNSAPDFEEWRQAKIIPRYNAAGIKKFAFLLPPGATQIVENGTIPATEGVVARFPTGYFGTRERVFSWFTEKQ
jgi:hypothetical protein